MGITKNTSTYNGNFLQKIINKSIYSNKYNELNINSPKPNNIEFFCQTFAKSRRLLSLFQILETLFAQFKKENRKAILEFQIVINIISYITKFKNRQYKLKGNNLFYNIKKFNSSIVAFQLNAYNKATLV